MQGWLCGIVCYNPEFYEGPIYAGKFILKEVRVEVIVEAVSKIYQLSAADMVRATHMQLYGTACDGVYLGSLLPCQTLAPSL